MATDFFLRQLSHGINPQRQYFQNRSNIAPAGAKNDLLPGFDPASFKMYLLLQFFLIQLIFFVNNTEYTAESHTSRIFDFRKNKFLKIF